MTVHAYLKPGRWGYGKICTCSAGAAAGRPVSILETAQCILTPSLGADSPGESEAKRATAIKCVFTWASRRCCPTQSNPLHPLPHPPLQPGPPSSTKPHGESCKGCGAGKADRNAKAQGTWRSSLLASDNTSKGKHPFCLLSVSLSVSFKQKKW